MSVDSFIRLEKVVAPGARQRLLQLYAPLSCVSLVDGALSHLLILTASGESDQTSHAHALSQISKSVGQSVGQNVGQSVGQSVGLKFHFVIHSVESFVVRLAVFVVGRCLTSFVVLKIPARVIL